MSEENDQQDTPAATTRGDSGVIKQGWLSREESVPGSIATWKKRWHVLTLQKLACYKHNTSNEPLSSVSVASVEEMAYGNIVDNKSFAFSLTTPRGKLQLAAEDEETREAWVKTLRALVPKAKVELAKEMLLRKARRNAGLEIAQQQIKEAIESIMNDSKRVAVRGGFKTYADALAGMFQELLKAVDQVRQMGLHSAKQCSFAVSGIVDSANSAAAICTNKAIQGEIVVRTRDIAVETANLLGYATTASHDQTAQANMYECMESIQDQVQQILEMLAAAGALQQELDDAKLSIEAALSPDERPKVIKSKPIEAHIEDISEQAKLLSAQLKTIQNNAAVKPEKVGEYSKEAARLMCELLDATNIIAVSEGVDPNDPEYLAGTGGISEHKKQQLESMLAAAKGFAAATTNMIDLLKQIPQQEDDENLQYRLSVATRSADNALTAFTNITGSLDTQPEDKSATKGKGGATVGAAQFEEVESVAAEAEMDAESELLTALRAIEESVARLANATTQMEQDEAVLGARASAQQTDMAIAGANGASAAILAAAQAMGDATKKLVMAASDAQKELKQDESSASTYRQDPNWQRGIAASGQAVSETVNQLVTVALDSNSTSEDIVAAARCVNGATARLIAYSRVKGDPNSEAHRSINTAARAIAQATNQLVNAAKSEKQNQDEASMDSDIEKLRAAPRGKQIKAEFEAQAKIAKLENELDEARQYLFRLRRAVYGNDPGGVANEGVKVGTAKKFGRNRPT